ncbi:MAG TPA: cell wall hydrolase [Alphaproteobacteria bacterium]|nr:cell wall hydrolase [Alphaproteobacteria bacterium]HNS44003.1 cell wall hydrolase [Alphaproteobacteria bacterium]
MDKPKLTPVPKEAADENAREFYKEMEVDILARTIWGEARGEGKTGMEAVAMVILNRATVAQARGGYWWGNSVIEVCQKPYQFSCWNKEDPNYRKLISVNDSDVYFATAQRVARRALLGFLKDSTYGATHYHARHASPSWTKGQRPCAVIGRHIFYHLAEG